MCKIDWNKPIQTREGHKAELIKTINAAGRTHIIVVTSKEGFQSSYRVYSDGRWSTYNNSRKDILNVPPKMKTVTGHIVLHKTSGTWIPYHEAIDMPQSRLEYLKNYYTAYADVWKVVPITFEVSEE